MRTWAGSAWAPTPAAGPYTYGNTSNTDYGVNRNTGAGALSGYAWSTTAGWINFAPYQRRRERSRGTASSAATPGARTSAGSSSMERPSTARLTKWQRPGLWP